MGILDLFRKNKDEVHGTKVLVCAIDNRFEDLLKTDSDVYRQYYRATTRAVLPSIQALLEHLGRNYDIVHLIADVTENGTIQDASGHEITGTELIQRCCDQDVKLWSASDNPPEWYIKGFGARGKHLNRVMTLKRKGANFPNFLQKMLSQMAYGKTMPIAWNDICPRIPGLEHRDSPESIFVAGRGEAKLWASPDLRARRSRLSNTNEQRLKCFKIDVRVAVPSVPPDR